MDKEKQEEAVRKLIKATKSGKPVIIVYSNPNTIISILRSSLAFFSSKKAVNMAKEEDGNGYFYQYPNEWWDRFNDVASVEILPWRSLGLKAQKALIPNNKIGSIMFSSLFKLEQIFPDFFVKHFLYSMITITKKE